MMNNGTTTGASARMKLALDRDVLLFFEDRDHDVAIPGDRRFRRFLRKTVAPVRPHRQHVSGFEMAFRKLCKALRLSLIHI